MEKDHGINGSDKLGKEGKPGEGEFFSTYFRFLGQTESPKIYHRWAIISTVAALLGRQLYLPFGHTRVYPNMYVWLVGTPGARKGTALNPIKNLLGALHYKKLSPQRLSPEMFLAALQRMNVPPGMDLLDELEISAIKIDAPCEMFVVADEIADFLRGNTDFCKVLTNLYDNLPFYDHPKLHGKSVYVFAPTINITGGITPEDIVLSVPPEAVGQGFFSRIILVHSEPTGIKITRPEAPTAEHTAEMVALLRRIMDSVEGEATITEAADIVLTAIYERYVGIQNVQFRHYNSRRFSHLLKLALVFAAIDCSTQIRDDHVLKANTLLYVTEHNMHKALGEFGKAKNVAVSYSIMEYLKRASAPVTLKELWRLVVNDLNKWEELIEIIKGLQLADKIQQVKLGERTGFLAKFSPGDAWQKGLLWEEEGFLFNEEKV